MDTALIVLFTAIWIVLLVAAMIMFINGIDDGNVFSFITLLGLTILTIVIECGTIHLDRTYTNMEKEENKELYDYGIELYKSGKDKTLAAICFYCVDQNSDEYEESVKYLKKLEKELDITDEDLSSIVYLIGN